MNPNPFSTRSVLIDPVIAFASLLRIDVRRTRLHPRRATDIVPYGPTYRLSHSAHRVSASARSSGEPTQLKSTPRASVVARGLKPISQGHRLPAAKFASTAGPFPFPTVTSVHVGAPRRVKRPLTS